LPERPGSGSIRPDENNLAMPPKVIEGIKFDDGVEVTINTENRAA
jgi:hypothetical protein